MAETEIKVKPEQGMKTFTLIWIGQVVSLLGSGLTNFALGVWVLQKTGSVTQFALITVIAGLPGILAAPLAGAFVDRWNRRLVLIVSDCGAGLGSLAVAILLWNDSLVVWHIYVVVAISSLFNTFQWPAYVSSITLLVKPDKYARINGMIEFGQSGSTIAAPALAGFLMVMWNIWGVLMIDFATFLFAITTLMLARIPQPKVSAEGEAAKGSIWKEAAYGWIYIKKRPGLLGLLIFFAAVNLVTSLCGITILPLVLRFATEAQAGPVMSCVGIGMLLGSLYMSLTGGPKKKIHGVLGGGMLFSVFIFMAGLRPSAWLVGVAVLLWFANVPIINSCSQAIWQRKVEPDVQGRVFAIRRMLAQFTVPLGDFSAGPLSDYVFEPLMAHGGPLSGSVGKYIGTGPGRGIALMYLTVAVLPFLIAVVGYLNPRVRNVEAELPDVITEDEAATEGSESEETA